MSDRDSVSFGRWRITRSDAGIPAAQDSVVELQLTAAELVLLNDNGRLLGRWPVAEVTLDAYGNDDGSLRLGSHAIEIRSAENQISRHLRDVIIRERGVAEQRKTPGRGGSAGRPKSGSRGPPNGAFSILRRSTTSSERLPLQSGAW